MGELAGVKMAARPFPVGAARSEDGGGCFRASRRGGQGAVLRRAAGRGVTGGDGGGRQLCQHRRVLRRRGWLPLRLLQERDRQPLPWCGPGAGRAARGTVSGPEAPGLLPAGAGGAEGGLGAAGKGGGLPAAFALPASVLPGAGSCPSLRKAPETPYPGRAACEARRGRCGAGGRGLTGRPRLRVL